MLRYVLARTPTSQKHFMTIELDEYRFEADLVETSTPDRYICEKDNIISPTQSHKIISPESQD